MKHIKNIDQVEKILKENKLEKIHREKPYIMQWQIAEMFNVHPGTISLIINGKIWRHIYDELNKTQ